VIEDQTYLIALLIFLIVLDLLAIAARSSLLHTNMTKLIRQREERIQEQNSQDRAVVMLSSPSRARASLNLLLAVTRFFIAGVILLLLMSLEWAIPFTWVAGGVLLLAVLLLFWIEWMVDSTVGMNAEVWMMRMVTPIRILQTLLYPLLWLPQALFRRNGVDLDVPGTVTQDELKSMVDASHQEGVLELDERKMIYSIFRLGDTLAREIMVPRIYVTAFEAKLTLSQAADAFLETGHSRVPVYEETVDDIIGLLYAKDLLNVWREDNRSESLRPLLRPAYFIPEAKKVDELLAEMQSQRIHMAIVVDEYGGIAGLVTMEDIVEEIVGEIKDEYDLSEELPYQEINEHEYLFQGRVNLDDFNELMDSHLPIDEADTLGGFMYSQIGRVPVGGESVQYGDLLLTVEQVSGRRIRKVRAQKTFQPPGAVDEPTKSDGRSNDK
jgi:putative hemolysin